MEPPGLRRLAVMATARLFGPSPAARTRRWPDGRVLLGGCLCLLAGWLIWGSLVSAGRPALRASADAFVPMSLASLAPLMGSTGEGPELCFLVRTMPSHFRNLPAMLLGLFASAPKQAVRVVLLRSYTRPAGPGGGAPVADQLDSIAALVNEAAPGRVEVSRWDASYTDTHFPELAKASYAKDGGFVVTDLAIEDILARRAAQQGAGYCDALVVTNGDNLYTGGFVPAVAEQLRAGFDVVGTHFVSRYDFSQELMDYNRARGRGPLRPGMDAEFTSSFAVGGIDLGAAAFRTELLERAGIRFIVDRLRSNPTGEGINVVQADGQFFENLAAVPGIKTTILQRVLFVHQ